MSSPPPPPGARPRTDARDDRPADVPPTEAGAAEHGPGTTGPSDGDGEGRAEELIALADWMTEEVAQQLYAARQDFADIAHADDTRRADVDDVNAQLLDVIRSLHEIAGVLRAGAAEARRAATAGHLADEVRATSATAHELITECLVLVDRGLALRGRPPADADGTSPATDG